MAEKLERRLRELKPDASVNTIKTYRNNILRLRRISATLNYSEISNYLKKLPPTIARNLLTAVIVLEGRERYGKLFDGLITEARKLRGTQTFSQAERAQWSSVKAVNAGLARAKFDVDRLKLLQIRKLNRKEYQILQEYLAIRFHSEFHWRSDLATIKIGHHAGENHFVNGQFILHHFKTAKHFKRKGLLPLRFKPKQGLKSLLDKFLRVREKQELNNEFLLTNRKGQPFSRSAFSKFLATASYRYVGKRIGPSMYRKIYVTDYLKLNPTLIQKKDTMRKMMQLSLETHESYARLNLDEPD